MPRRKRTPEELITAFWSRVDIGNPDECWEWTWGRFPSGYGAFPVDRVPTGAHRIAYELSKGPIPEGRMVHHVCENKPCCNPAHLMVVTPREHGRHQPLAVATHCKRGHPFDAENTGWQGPEKQWRICKTCWKDRTREAEERRKQKRRKA